jgi:hypothetical protein
MKPNTYQVRARLLGPADTNMYEAVLMSDYMTLLDERDFVRAILDSLIAGDISAKLAVHQLTREPERTASLAVIDRIVMAYTHRHPRVGMQREIARITGMSTTVVNRWFKRSAVPHNDYILKLAIELEVRNTWLLTGEGEMEYAPDVNQK